MVWGRMGDGVRVFAWTLQDRSTAGGWAKVSTDTRDRVWTSTYLFLAFLPTVLSVRLRHHPVDLRKKKNSFPQVPLPPLHTEARGKETVLQTSTIWKLLRFPTLCTSFPTGSLPPANE